MLGWVLYGLLAILATALAGSPTLFGAFSLAKSLLVISLFYGWGRHLPKVFWVGGGCEFALAAAGGFFHGWDGEFCHDVGALWSGVVTVGCGGAGLLVWSFGGCGGRFWGQG